MRLNTFYVISYSDFKVNGSTYIIPGGNKRGRNREHSLQIFQHIHPKIMIFYDTIIYYKSEF